MKSSIFAIVSLVLTVNAGAQSAKVVPLSSEDTAEVKALYAEQAEIQKKIDDFRRPCLGEIHHYETSRKGLPSWGFPALG